MVGTKEVIAPAVIIVVPTNSAILPPFNFPLLRVLTQRQPRKQIGDDKKEKKNEKPGKV